MWENLKGFFSALSTLNCVIMRNYSDIESQVFYGEDIDILCSDRDCVIKELKLLPLNNNEKCYNFYTVINGQKVFVDLRNVGDNYYCEKWEKDMLLNKTAYKNFFVMDNDNYRYSYLYHVFVHKEKLEKKHYDNLSILFDGLVDEKVLFKKLVAYMKGKKYKVVVPCDKGVTLNKKNIFRLKTKLFFA